jgi:predicted metalloprotease
VKLKIALGLALALVIVRGAVVHAQNDWEVLPSHPKEGRSASVPPATSSEKSAPKATSTSPVDHAFSVCDEQARPASPRVKAMVARINALWGSNFQAYQTIAPEAPHAAAGGCIFYNTSVMAALMVGRLDVADSNVVEPLLWAIFAHEVGHEVHADFSSSRAAANNETKELEADRFAGYTLEKLKIRASDLTPYWTMTGDEFGAGHYRHGSSQQRVAAFKQGWHLAEWDRGENSATVQSALDEPVAPDDPDSAPQ